MGVAEELQKLQQLRDSGAINDDEFAAAKARVLDGSTGGSASGSWGFSANTALSSEELEKQSRQWAMLLHLSALLGYGPVPVAGLFAPIIVWQLKKSELPAIDEHGRNAVNWMISSLIYLVVSSVLTAIVIGIPLLLAVIVCGVVFPIIAGVKASNGEVWKYPLTIEFIKPDTRF